MYIKRKLERRGGRESRFFAAKEESVRTAVLLYYLGERFHTCTWTFS